MRSMRPGARDRVLAVLALGTVLGLGAVGTMAAWTDDSTATSSFSTGSVSLRLTATNLKAAAFDDLTVANLAPGRSIAGRILVRNRGTLPFSYTLAIAATNPDGDDLESALRTVVMPGGTISGSGTSETCTSGTSTPINRLGLAGSAVAMSNQRAAGTDEWVCVQVGLPTDAVTSVQSASTKATLTFTATSQ
jgi:predicted ribosomally synthesized peptide with SipW-like signal peptide